MDAVRLHTSFRLAVSDPVDIEWRAAAEDQPRHAFVPRDGFPKPALCGERWSVLFRHHGSAACAPCLDVLREQLRAATAAIAAAEAPDQAGDHYAGMGR